jgi:hypothetical protein
MTIAPVSVSSQDFYLLLIALVEFDLQDVIMPRHLLRRRFPAMVPARDQ